MNTEEPENKPLKFGLLTTIDNPLLPTLTHALLKQDIINFCIIYDSKNLSIKDRLIWDARTGNFFDEMSANYLKSASFYELNVPTFHVGNHNDQTTIDLIEEKRIDCLLNAGTPRKLNSELIDSVHHGIVNIHPGLLPHFRGCSAVEWSIWGDHKVGNTAHFMGKEYDSGPIIMSETYDFSETYDYKKIRSVVFFNGCIMSAMALKIIQEKKMTPSDGILQNELYAKFWEPMPDHILETVKEKVAAGRFLS
jgi:folate-dependent phosphoribosylglycinamide formyltransferase PurN